MAHLLHSKMTVLLLRDELTYIEVYEILVIPDLQVSHQMENLLLHLKMMGLFSLDDMHHLEEHEDLVGQDL